MVAVKDNIDELTALYIVFKNMKTSCYSCIYLYTILSVIDTPQKIRKVAKENMLHRKALREKILVI